MLNQPPLDVDPEKLDLRMLPFALQDIARVIGLSAALQLVDRYPGIKIYVPAAASEQHELALCIGLPAMEKLCGSFGPGGLYVPKLDRILRQLKHKMLVELREQGYSVRDIALALNYNERSVWRIAHDSSSANSSNLDLFSDNNDQA